MTWRVGRKVPRNLYRGDEPIAMLATAELAQEIAERLNSAEQISEQAARQFIALQRMSKERDDLLAACGAAEYFVERYTRQTIADQTHMLTQLRAAIEGVKR
jgi:hypothetical protein